MRNAVSFHSHDVEPTHILNEREYVIRARVGSSGTLAAGSVDQGSVSRSSAISPSCTAVPSRWSPRPSAARAPGAIFHDRDRRSLRRRYSGSDSQRARRGAVSARQQATEGTIDVIRRLDE